MESFCKKRSWGMAKITTLSFSFFLYLHKGQKLYGDGKGALVTAKQKLEDIVSFPGC